MVVVMVVITASIMICITIVIFWPPCQSLECPFPRGISPRQEAAAKIMINWRTVINMIIILLLDISSSSPPPPPSSSPKSSTWNSVSSLPWTTCWWILRWIFISWSIYKNFFYICYSFLFNCTDMGHMSQLLIHISGYSDNAEVQMWHLKENQLQFLWQVTTQLWWVMSDGLRCGGTNWHYS